MSVFVRYKYWPSASNGFICLDFFLKMPEPPIVFGIASNHVHDIREFLQVGVSSSADFVVAPLFHPRLQRDDKGVTKHRQGPGKNYIIRNQKHVNIVLDFIFQ